MPNEGTKSEGFIRSGEPLMKAGRRRTRPPTIFVGVSGSSGGIADASSSSSSAAGKPSMRFGTAAADLSQCEVPFASEADGARPPQPPPPPEVNGAKSEVLVSQRDAPCCQFDEGWSFFVGDSGWEPIR